MGDMSSAALEAAPSKTRPAVRHNPDIHPANPRHVGASGKSAKTPYRVSSYHAYTHEDIDMPRPHSPRLTRNDANRIPFTTQPLDGPIQEQVNIYRFLTADLIAKDPQ
jgi:hypothetical protein